MTLEQHTKWLWWVPARGETREDARECDDRADREPELVARDLAEEDWHYQSPDYWDELTIVLLAPGSAVESLFTITTEARPHFYVRGAKS